MPHVQPPAPHPPGLLNPSHWQGCNSGKWCSYHKSAGHSLKECGEVAHRCSPQIATHATTLAAMTAAAMALATALLPHMLQPSIFAAMTAATASACPSDFAIVTESNTCAAVGTLDLATNKQHSIYSVFSLLVPVHLPTIADTGATQHTTNWRDLLHYFVPLPFPSQLMCADCIGDGTLHGITTVFDPAVWSCKMSHTSLVHHTPSYHHSSC